MPERLINLTEAIDQRLVANAEQQGVSVQDVMLDILTRYISLIDTSHFEQAVTDIDTLAQNLVDMENYAKELEGILQAAKGRIKELETEKTRFLTGLPFSSDLIEKFGPNPE